MKESELSTESIQQNLIKPISNLCFSVCVFLVLIFTVIAITYQPPDPWLESAPALTKLFTQTENSTFKNDDSILKTGEDLRNVATPAALDPITETVIEKSEEKISNLSLKSDCEEDVGALNCSDPRILLTVERFNLKIVKLIVFLEYQTPVSGSKPDERDVAWRFRIKKEKSWRKYRDFRRFEFGIREN